MTIKLAMNSVVFMEFSFYERSSHPGPRDPPPGREHRLISSPVSNQFAKPLTECSAGELTGQGTKSPPIRLSDSDAVLSVQRLNETNRTCWNRWLVHNAILVAQKRIRHFLAGKEEISRGKMD